MNHPNLRCVLAGLILAVLAILPEAGRGWTPVIAISAPAIVAGLSVMSGRLFQLARLVVVVLVALFALLRIADYGAGRAYGRAFDPLVDMGLLPAAWQLARGTLGLMPAALILLGLLVGLVALLGLLFWALGGARHPGAGPRRFWLTATLVLAAALGLARTTGLGLPIGAPAVERVAAHISQARQTYARLEAFEAQLARDPLADLDAGTRFSALAGQDVMIWFVESYGRATLYDARYGPTVRKRLDAVGAALAERQMAARSAWLVSPTYGGMSWLAHGALLSGLWTDNQKRYDAMIDSDRASLNRLFRQAGWTTIAAVPAIMQDWPEAAYFGFDTIYDAHGLGYRGRRFNWVTMPDQFTLNRVRQIVGGTERPAMVEVSLISSHAPWTPIPHLVDWNAIDDGHIFDAQALAGDSPQAVWSDTTRTRAQYLKSIDYVWATLGEYMTRYGDDTVFVIVGDHQPAPVITGSRDDYRVPITIVTDRPALLERLDARYWQPGLVPADDLPARGMDTFRETFTRAMSD